VGQVAIVSIRRCRGGLQVDESGRDWRRRLEELHRAIARDLAGRELPDPAEDNRKAHEERDEAIHEAILGLH